MKNSMKYEYNMLQKSKIHIRMLVYNQCLNRRQIKKYVYQWLKLIDAVTNHSDWNEI